MAAAYHGYNCSAKATPSSRGPHSEIMNSIGALTHRRLLHKVVRSGIATMLSRSWHGTPIWEQELQLKQQK